MGGRALHGRRAPHQRSRHRGHHCNCNPFTRALSSFLRSLTCCLSALVPAVPSSPVLHVPYVSLDVIFYWRFRHESKCLCTRHSEHLTTCFSPPCPLRRIWTRSSPRCPPTSKRNCSCSTASRTRSISMIFLSQGSSCTCHRAPPRPAPTWPALQLRCGRRAPLGGPPRGGAGPDRSAPRGGRAARPPVCPAARRAAGGQVRSCHVISVLIWW